MMKKDEHDTQMRLREQQYKTKMTTYHDGRQNAKIVDIKVGDQVLRPQKKTTVNPPFNPVPLTVVKRKGYSLTAKTPKGKLVTRAANKFKKVGKRDPFFDKTAMPRIDSDTEDELPFHL